MESKLTAEDARQSLTDHVAAKGAEIREKYGPRIGWHELLRILEDRTVCRYPCEIVFDAEPLHRGGVRLSKGKGGTPGGRFYSLRSSLLHDATRPGAPSGSLSARGGELRRVCLGGGCRNIWGFGIGDFHRGILSNPMRDGGRDGRMRGFRLRLPHSKSCAGIKVRFFVNFSFNPNQKPPINNTP